MRKLTRFLYQIMLVILLCWGAHAWFTWEWDYLGLGRFSILFAFIVIALLYASTNKVKFSLSSKKIGILFLWCIASLPPEFKIVSPFMEGLRFFPLLMLFGDKNNLESHLKTLSVSVAIILIPGMILWALIQTGIFTLPGIPVQMGQDDELVNYYFYNYFILLHPIVIESTRFQSIFLEPGYLGTLLALLLYANKYQWKRWYNWVLLLGLIIAQSLAGYVTFVLGYALYLSIFNKSNKATIISVLVLFVVFVYGVQNYNGGDNYLNHNIIERLTDTENDKYVFSGNIRTKEITNKLFEAHLSSGDVLFGETKKLDVPGAGYKVFLIKNGLFAAMLYFFVYFMLSRITHNRRYGFYYFVLVFMTFLQAAYPFSYSWIIPYMLGILLDNQTRGKVGRKFCRNEDIVY